MYVCGMTVYDYCHIGHARVLVSFDVITVIYVRVVIKSNMCVILPILMTKLSNVPMKMANQ